MKSKLKGIFFLLTARNWLLYTDDRAIGDVDESGGPFLTEQQKALEAYGSRH